MDHVESFGLEHLAMQGADLDAVGPVLRHQVRQSAGSSARLKAYVTRPNLRHLYRHLCQVFRRRVILVGLLVGEAARRHHFTDRLSWRVLELIPMPVAPVLDLNPTKVCNHALNLVAHGLVFRPLPIPELHRIVDALFSVRITPCRIGLVANKAVCRLKTSQRLNHRERQRTAHHHEILGLLLRLLAKLRRDRHRVELGQHTVKPPRHIWMHFKVSSAALVSAQAKRPTVNRYPLSTALFPRIFHDTAGSVPCRLAATHEFGDHAAQVIDVANTLIIRRAVACDQVRNNHPIAECSRRVGDVVSRQRTENPIDALGHELGAAVQQVLQRGTHNFVFKLRRFLLADHLVPLVTAGLRHCVIDIGERQRFRPVGRVQRSDCALFLEHLVSSHCHRVTATILG